MIIHRLNRFLLRAISIYYRSDSAKKQGNRTVTVHPVQHPDIFEGTYCVRDKDCCRKCNGTCNGRHLYNIVFTPKKA